MKKQIKLSLAIAILFLMSVQTVSATNQINTYTYDFWGKEKRSPAGYQLESQLMGQEMGTTALSNPQDFFIDSKGQIYIADTGNSRVILLNADCSFQKEWKTLSYEGSTVALSAPTGLFVTEDNQFYVVDEESKITYHCDEKGNVLHTYERPDSEETQFTGIDYIPQKVIADENGYVFIQCKDLYQGAMMYHQDGTFISYYGSNPATLTISQTVQQVFKRFMTKEQRSKISQVIPTAISNFDIDRNGFIYTTTAAAGTATDQIRRLNPKSINVMPSSDAIKVSYANVYGDLETKWANGTLYETKMVDVCFDDRGFINGLDQTRGRIFQYDKENHLVFAFGGIGDQKESFQQAAAIDCYQDKLFVLDSEKGCLTVFAETQYGAAIHQAVALYNQGQYASAAEHWKQVLQQNSNYTLAYIGMGKIAYEQQDYHTAMQYFRRGEARDNYGDAFKQVRNNFLRTYGIQAGLGILCVFLAVFGIRRIVQKTNRTKKKQ